MLDRGHPARDIQSENAAVKTLDRGQRPCDTQRRIAAVNPRREPGPEPPDTHAASARLTFFAALLDDLESARQAAANRAGALERLGVIPHDALTTALDGIAEREHYAALELKRALRQHPLGPWVTATIGIGEKQGARLIAAIGDPAWNDAEDRPRRGPAELWAYCGYVPGQKRQKGVKANWNATAKMRAYLCAVSCLKQARSPFRAVYDARRAHTAETHPDWTPGHSHNDALHIVAKEILKDLWRAAARSATMPTRSAPQPVGALA